MRLHYYVLLSASASLTGNTEAAYLPKLYTWGMALSQHVLVRNGLKVESHIVFVSQSSQSLFDVVKDCKNAEGTLVGIWECANSIVQSGAAVALAACAYRHGDVATKRSASDLDVILSRFPSEVKITDLTIRGESLPSNASHAMLNRRDVDSTAEPILVAYNGTLPFTFIIHSTITSNATDPELDDPASESALLRREARDSLVGSDIPIFIATDGMHWSIHHIAAIDNGTTTLGGDLVKRGGINGYNHIGVGGMKVGCNSDAVAYWDDVINWLDKSRNYSPLYYLVYYTKLSMFVGHSFSQWAYPYGGTKGYNGQFVLEGETVPFNGAWEDNWNWCFGVYPTNC